MPILDDVQGVSRTWYTYRYYLFGEEKHGGITQNPARRQDEHQRTWPDGEMRIVDGPISEKEARVWEKANGYS